MIVDAAWYDGNGHRTGTFADYLVSVRYGQAAPLSPVRSTLEDDPERLRLGVGAVLQAALAQVVDSYEAGGPRARGRRARGRARRLQ